MDSVRQPIRRLSAVFALTALARAAVAASLTAAVLIMLTLPAAARPPGPGGITASYTPQVGDSFWTSGTSGNLDQYKAPYKTSLPPGKGAGNVVAAAVAPNNRVYAWYSDGTVSSGTTKDLDAYKKPYDYSMPVFDPWDIRGIAIASNSRVYAWYRNGTVSVGTSFDLDAYKAPYPYSLPTGYNIGDIVDMAIAKSSDHVYVWYRNGRASSGTSWDLDKYRKPYAYTTHPEPSPPVDDALLGVGIASNDHVYALHGRFIPVP